jgi:hypothetical protein
MKRLRSTSAGRWWLVWVTGGRKWVLGSSKAVTAACLAVFDPSTNSALSRQPESVEKSHMGLYGPLRLTSDPPLTSTQNFPQNAKIRQLLVGLPLNKAWILFFKLSRLFKNSTCLYGDDGSGDSCLPIVGIVARAQTECHLHTRRMLVGCGRAGIAWDA